MPRPFLGDDPAPAEPAEVLDGAAASADDAVRVLDGQRAVLARVPRRAAA